MNKSVGKIRGGRLCCVPGCSHTDKRNPEFTFYSFPNREYEVKRKETWIALVRRDSIRTKPWAPTKYSRICSAHFVGGKKSNDPREESFNPSIFPWRKKTDSDVAKKLRLTGRNKKKDDNGEVNCNNSAGTAESDTVRLESTAAELLPFEFVEVKLEGPQTCEIAIQTDENVDFSAGEETVLFCWLNSDRNDASTQTAIPINNSRQQKVRVIEIEVPQKKTSRTIAI